MMSDEGESFELLTDALRCGPGGPLWAHAVQTARQLSGAAEGDEYRLIVEARQKLQSLIGYRELRSNPRLTQRILGAISDEANAQLRARSARRFIGLAVAASFMIAGIAGMVVEAMLAGHGTRTVTIHLPTSAIYPSGPDNFETALPTNWQSIGALRVRAAHGLRLAGGPKQIDQFGGLVCSEPLPKGGILRLTATVGYRAGSNAWPELFVTDDPDFAADPPSERRHELAWVLADDRPMVRTPASTMLAAGDRLPFGKAATATPNLAVSQMLNVEIKLAGGAAVVETTSGGHKLGCWVGPSGLDASKDWHLGVRFVVHGQKHDDCVEVDAIRVNRR